MQRVFRSSATTTRPTGRSKVAHCNDADCAGPAAINTVDESANVGQYSSSGARPGGLPVVSYYDADAGDLKVARCSDANCAGETVTPVSTGDGDIGQYSSFRSTPATAPSSPTTTPTRRPARLAYCSTSTAAVQTDVLVDGATTEVGISLSMALAGDNPVISYYDNETCR